MGTVWRAFNIQLEIPVAIKLLRPGLNGAELAERLRVEARAAAKLVHPSIVRVYDIGEAESGDPFIVMELLNGESLGDRLERDRLEPSGALQLLLPIAEGLALAHSRGVVHRDLKPDNIFLAQQGDTLQPKLLDFGIAKVESSRGSGAPTLTQTGTLMGSPEYMSPEQAQGLADIDERSDVWAFCVVLYEALAGQTPFHADSWSETLQRVVNDDPVPLTVQADIEPELSALVQRGLAKDRTARPASMVELGRQLAAWLCAHGVHEDVTGTALEAKWLGRPSIRLAESQVAPLVREAREPATLISVVHPSSTPDVVATASGQARRRPRRWAPIALALAVAVLVPFGWIAQRAALRGLTSAQEDEARAAVKPTGLPPPLPTSRASISAAPPPPQLRAQRSVAPVVTLPVVPIEAEPPSRPPARRARALVATASLPRALPMRQGRAELLNPY
jgi:serine/threonine-protein kinase